MTSSSETSNQMDPSERTVALLLSRGLTTEEAWEWGDGLEEEQAKTIADWLEAHPKANDLEIMKMLIEVLIPEEIRNRYNYKSK